MARVRRLVESVRKDLSDSECSEIEHLIEHSEIGEAIRTLAWIIVDDRKVIDRLTYAEMLELAAGLVEPEHMPSELNTCVRAE